MEQFYFSLVTYSTQYYTVGAIDSSSTVHIQRKSLHKPHWQLASILLPLPSHSGSSASFIVLTAFLFCIVYLVVKSFGLSLSSSCLQLVAGVFVNNPSFRKYNHVINKGCFESHTALLLHVVI